MTGVYEYSALKKGIITSEEKDKCIQEVTGNKNPDR